MKDEQWISAMRKYDGTTDFFNGGPNELSTLLREQTRKDRIRFASLIKVMPHDINPIYFSAILDGLCGRYTNVPEEEKEENDRSFNETPTETFMTVIDRLHKLQGNPCGEAICGNLKILANKNLPPIVFEIVSYYAMRDPDPKEDIWRQTTHSGTYYGGSPHNHGMNSVRGKAAEAISAMIFHDYSRLDVLQVALVSLSEDPVISVRTCAIEAFLPLLNCDRNLAVELFLVACENCIEICATSPFETFLRYAVFSHYKQLNRVHLETITFRNRSAKFQYLGGSTLAIV